MTPATLGDTPLGPRVLDDIMQCVVELAQPERILVSGSAGRRFQGIPYLIR